MMMMVVRLMMVFVTMVMALVVVMMVMVQVMVMVVMVVMVVSMMMVVMVIPTVHTPRSDRFPCCSNRKCKCPPEKVKFDMTFIITNPCLLRKITRMFN